MSQNEQLLLETYRTTPTRAFERLTERKTRLHSVLDERRRLSAWEQFTNTEVQTDDVSEICACSELTVKVKELKIEVRKRLQDLNNGANGTAQSTQVGSRGSAKIIVAGAARTQSDEGKL